MNKKQVAIYFRKTFIELLDEQGITLPVIKGYQPTTRGKPKDYIMFFDLDDVREGWQERVYKETTATESKPVTASFQIQAVVYEDVNDMDQLTSSDICSVAQSIIASLKFSAAMAKKSIGVIQPTSIRAPYFINEKDQYEANPSFDFGLIYKQSIIQKHNEAKVVEIIRGI